MTTNGNTRILDLYFQKCNYGKISFYLTIYDYSLSVGLKAQIGYNGETIIESIERC